jgi:hypothetical protein
MKARTILVSLAMFCAGLALCLAADMNLGTWKLNEARSKIPAGAMKNHTVVYAAVGDSVKITVDGVDGDGKPTHSEWTGKYDGKDYPVTGDPTSDARSYTKLDDRRLDFEAKKSGRTFVTGHVVVSANGKSRTVVATGPDSSGKKVTSTASYDKQ